MTRGALFLVAIAAVLGASPGCSDPIQQGRIEAMGPETEGIPVGPLHRAGQLCVVCHSEEGPAESVFSVAGTIFSGPQKYVGVDNAEVRMTDSLGTKYIAKTNCVGNFFVKPEEWDPKFPILVAVAKGGTLRQMNSVIGREPDCAACHTPSRERDLTSQVAQVFLFATEEIGGSDPSLCEVDPRIR